MKKMFFIQGLFFILCTGLLTSLKAQTSPATVKSEIMDALQLWNNAAKNANVEACMAQFDKTDDIILVGSDSGEIYKGKEEIRGWLTRLFKHAGFSWEMNRIDIDSHDNTAWVFMNGKMVVKWDSGQTRKTPYRFTGILVKENNVWKWRLFNGSNPRGE
jgi:ketosteroid isomerase-like protein